MTPERAVTWLENLVRPGYERQALDTLEECVEALRALVDACDDIDYGGARLSVPLERARDVLLDMP